MLDIIINWWYGTDARNTSKVKLTKLSDPTVGETVAGTEEKLRVSISKIHTDLHYLSTEIRRLRWGSLS